MTTFGANNNTLLTLTRTERNEDGTFGKLYTPGISLYTMEDDWIDNKPIISCIPAGIYILRRTIYHKHNIETFEVTGVPGRSRILIHPANTEEDVEGCIGVGMRMGTLLRKDEDTGQMHLKTAVVASQEAFRRFMLVMLDVDEAKLLVRWTAATEPPKPEVIV